MAVAVMHNDALGLRMQDSQSKYSRLEMGLWTQDSQCKHSRLEMGLWTQDSQCEHSNRTGVGNGTYTVSVNTATGQGLEMGPWTQDGQCEHSRLEMGL